MWTSINFEQALQKLKDGNQRYVEAHQEGVMHSDAKLRQSLSAGQMPFAVILGCSDSRAPVELVFDQGLGDLFVIRVAGNVAQSSQVASAEFAVANFRTPLIVVLGHSHCGALKSTLEHIQDPTMLPPSSALSDLIRRISPAIEPLTQTDDDNDTIMKKAIKTNVEQTIKKLKTSEIISKAIEDDKVHIVGAKYDIENGKVTFYD